MKSKCHWRCTTDVSITWVQEVIEVPITQYGPQTSSRSTAGSSSEMGKRGPTSAHTARVCTLIRIPSTALVLRVIQVKLQTSPMRNIITC